MRLALAAVALIVATAGAVPASAAVDLRRSDLGGPNVEDARLTTGDVDGDALAAASSAMRRSGGHGSAHRSRLRFPSPDAPYVRADHTLRVPVRCSRGLGGCRGRIGVKDRRPRFYDLRAGQRDVVRLRFTTIPTDPVTIVARTAGGQVRTHVSAHRASAAERAAACVPPGSRTLARSPAGRLFFLRDDPYEQFPLGCLRRRGGWRHLPGDSDELARAATNGRWAAYQTIFQGDGEEPDEDAIALYDLRRGRLFDTAPVAAHCEGRRCEDNPFIGSIVVTGGGAMAWIACAREVDCLHRKYRRAKRDVYRYDSRGLRRVAVARRLRARSLRWEGRGRFSWRQRGHRAHAQLRGRAPGFG